MYYVSLPTEDAHQGHPIGAGTAGFAQRVNDKVTIKISELGVTETHSHVPTSALCPERFVQEQPSRL